MNKYIRRTLLFYLIGLLILIIVNFLFFYNRIIFILIPLLSFAVSYFMPEIFKLFFKATVYNGNYRDGIFEYSEKHGLKLEEVYVIPSKKSNGCAIGLFDKKSVVFTSNTINSHPWDEIEGVLAHELGHHVDKDIFIYTLVIALMLMFSVVVTSLQVFIFSNQILGILVWSVILSIIFLTIALLISRSREGLADVYAKKILNDPDQLVRFLKKVILNEDKETQKIIENPSVIDKFFFTHPWIVNRIKFLDS